MSPGRQRTPRPYHLAHTRPHSLPRTPKITSLSRATRSRRCPIQPHARPTSSPRLRHFSPPIRPNPAISPPLLKHTHIRATLANARDRPCGPQTLPQTGRASGIRVGVPCGRPVAVNTLLRPSVLLCHLVSPLCPKKPAPALQIRTEPATPSARRRTECRRI